MVFPSVIPAIYSGLFFFIISLCALRALCETSFFLVKMSNDKWLFFSVLPCIFVVDYIFKVNYGIPTEIKV